MKACWSWHELPLQELGQFSTFRQLSQRYGSRDAIGLITRLEALQNFVVVNLLAPQNSAFWGVCNKYIDSREHLEKAGLRDDEVTRKLFLRDLRRASVKRMDPAIHLFRVYDDYFPRRSRSYPGFSEDGVTLESYRFISYGCNEIALPRLIADLESQAQQFGDLGFFAVDDCINLNPGNYVAKEKPPYDYLFRRWVVAGYDGHKRTEWFSALKCHMEHTLTRIMAGDKLDVPVSPVYFINPGASFVLMDKESGWYDEVGDATCRTIMSIRARLVRELAWPAFYNDVCHALAPGFDGEPRRIDTYGRLEPYDIVTELEEYKQVVERRYPCLLENPL